MRRVRERKTRYFWGFFALVLSMSMMTYYITRHRYLASNIPLVKEEKVTLEKVVKSDKSKVFKYYLILQEYPSLPLVISPGAKVPRSLKSQVKLRLKYYEKQGAKCLLYLKLEDEIISLGELGGCLSLKP